MSFFNLIDFQLKVFNIYLQNIVSKFLQIPIKKIRKLTADSANIVLDLSLVDSENFSFKSGQYITIKQYDNENIRRSYSISSSPESGIEIGMKLPNGLMSTFLTTKLKEGDILNVATNWKFYFRYQHF